MLWLAVATSPASVQDPAVNPGEICPPVVAPLPDGRTDRRLGTNRWRRRRPRDVVVLSAQRVQTRRPAFRRRETRDSVPAMPRGPAGSPPRPVRRHLRYKGDGVSRPRDGTMVSFDMWKLFFPLACTNAYLLFIFPRVADRPLPWIGRFVSRRMYLIGADDDYPRRCGRCGQRSPGRPGSPAPWRSSPASVHEIP